MDSTAYKRLADARSAIAWAMRTWADERTALEREVKELRTYYEEEAETNVRLRSAILTALEEPAQMRRILCRALEGK